MSGTQLENVAENAESLKAFMYGDVPDESEFLRTARSVWLEIKADNVEAMRRKILDFGVRKLDIPDPHLYFQAPGGQVLRLVGIDEDLSFYEGAGDGPNVAKVRRPSRTQPWPNEPTGLIENGTTLTMREEGYIGRADAAYGNAEHWERVLAWLDTYMRGTR